MRRAEKAGREDASTWVAVTPGAEEVRSELLTAAEGFSPARFRIGIDGRSHFERRIGAHQLIGRSFQAACEAYDKGYRERLKEALAEVSK